MDEGHPEQSKAKNDRKEVTPLEDSRIIELYFSRDEAAIDETQRSYGRLLISVAMNILRDSIDAEECETDTYVRAWDSIPPTRPTYLSAFLTKITRNLAINRLRDNKRRRPIDSVIILDELSEAIPETAGELSDQIALKDALDEFLGSLDATKRQIFVKRYFYMREIKDIAREMSITVTSVKVALCRTRRQLRTHLEERGIVI